MSIPHARTSTLEVLNPATLDVVGEVPNSTHEELSAAVEAARQARPSWAELPDRADLLLACANEIKSKLVSLALLLTQEQGKPLRESMEELMGATHWLRSVAELPLPPRQEISSPQGIAHLDRRPAGTVAAITPWNYPVILAIWKIAPALLTGNCVILKPSQFAPLTISEIGKALSGHLPPGVLQVLTGDDETGRELVAHSGIDHVSLTGSVTAGRSVGAQAGHNLKGVTLELGGNDAALVLEDADPSTVAEEIIRNAFKNCGQTCTAIKRVYVHRSLHDELAEAMAACASSLVVGNGMEPASKMGPINNAPQLARVESLLADAVNRGGSLACGGKRIDLPGYFHQPTIVTGLSNDAPLVAEEQFGPALPLLEFDEVSEAIEQANASPFGLGGSVWSADPARAMQVAQRLQCGTTWINRHSITDPAIPLGGTKDSGLGYANGQAGLEEFTRLRVSYS